MKVIVTGSAGFIGAHLCAALLRTGGYEVLGVDNFNEYYASTLKRARVAALAPSAVHHQINIANHKLIEGVFREFQPDVVVHLAAQAGVRYSFEAPMEYADSNLMGQVSVLEAVRKCESVKRFIYASSSSVYSGVSSLPFREDLPLARPKSLYAATKIADEILTDGYCGMLDLDAIGLRFFTVYGPWGRPDMAYWSFAESILSGRKIKLFNYGDVRRDFTYVDDIVSAIIRMVDETSFGIGASQHRLYNIGNNKPEPVRKVIEILSELLGRSPLIELAPLPPGDMVETYADVTKLHSDYEFAPDTPLERGLSSFVTWFSKWRASEYA